jgi:hypothetical protein
MHSALDDVDQCGFIAAGGRQTFWLGGNRTHNALIMPQWDLPMARREDE